MPVPQELLCLSSGIFFSLLFVALTVTSLAVNHLLAPHRVDSEANSDIYP
ncbi:MAG TPA: hypothetical protein V6C72_08960 [Chroococcales cyanobacterium]